MGLKLDLGCGDSCPPGYIGIDIDTHHPVTKRPTNAVIHDLNEGIPYDDGIVEAIRACHILEHIKEPVCLLKEIYRVACDGAIVDIEVPLYEIGFRIGGNLQTPISIIRLGCGTHYSVFHEDWFEMHLDESKWQIQSKDVQWVMQNDFYYARLKLLLRIKKSGYPTDI